MSEEIGQYSAVDMATAAAKGFRDGVASVANSEKPNNLRTAIAELEQYIAAGIAQLDDLRDKLAEELAAIKQAKP